MVIRTYKPTDFKEVVNMYYELTKEVYSHRKIAHIDNFYKAVNEWIDCNYDIIIIEKDGIVAGFGVAYIDSMGGLLENYYLLDNVYIKPEYRKTRSLYFIVQYCLHYAQSQGYVLAGNASDITESSRISAKFGLKVFTRYEKLPKEKE